LQFQPEYIDHHVCTLNVQIDFNNHVIILSKLADWNSAHSQPVDLINENLIKSARGPKSQPVSYLPTDVLEDRPNG